MNLIPCPFCKGEVKMHTFGRMFFIEHVSASVPRCILINAELGSTDAVKLAAQWNRREGI